MGKRGPRAWKPTPEEIAQIREAAGFGVTVEQIAAMMGKSEDTLRKHAEIRDALAAGKGEIIAQVAGALVKKALGGDTASMIFYLKTQAGWKETARHEHSGPDGKPVQMELRDLSNLTDEQLEVLERAALAFASGASGADGAT